MPTVKNFRWKFKIPKFQFPNFAFSIFNSQFTLSPPHPMFQFLISLQSSSQTEIFFQMDSSAAAGYHLRHSPSPTHHFLDLFSSPPPHTSTVVSGSDEFNESEVFWTGDFGVSNYCPFRSRRISKDDRASSFVPPPNSGILAALTDDAGKRIGAILTREATMDVPSSSSRSIPRPVQSSRDYSQSAPCRKFERSAPINVPKAMRKQRNNEEIVGIEEEEEILPPHEIVARGSGVSPNTTFSVLEGVGRTLKGRDLRRVRNAVWHRTGFVD